MSIVLKNGHYYAVIYTKLNLFSNKPKKQSWLSLQTKNKKVAIERYNMLLSKINNSFCSNQGNFIEMPDNSQSITIQDILDTPSPYDYSLEYANLICEYISNQYIGKMVRTLDYYKQAYKTAYENYVKIDTDPKIFDQICSGKPFLNLPIPTENTKKIFSEIVLRSLLYTFENQIYNLLKLPYEPQNFFNYGIYSFEQLEEQINFVRTNLGYFANRCNNMQNINPFSQASMQTNQFPNSNINSISPICNTHSKQHTFIEIAEKINQLNSKENVSADTKKDTLSKATILQELLGKNKTIETTNKDDLQKAVKEIPFITPGLRHRNDPHYSLKKNIEEGKNNEALCISEKTLKRYRSVVCQIYSYANKNLHLEDLYHELDWPVAKGSNIEKSYDYFRIKQLNAIFSLPLFRKCKDYNHWADEGNYEIRNFRYWVPLLGLYTGARLSELCQLRKNDIKMIEDVWCICINNLEDKRVKTPQSIRNVPIHSKLIELGFLEYVQKQESNRIFDDIAIDGKGRYDSFSKWFKRVLATANDRITDDGYKMNSDHVFHSFRHTVRTEFRSNNIPVECVNILCGWEKKKQDTSGDGYGDLYMSKRKEIIENGLLYTGLIIP